jgi:hypothetical protein
MSYACGNLRARAHSIVYASKLMGWKRSRWKRVEKGRFGAKRAKRASLSMRRAPSGNKL